MEQIQEQLIDWLSPRQSTGAQTTTAIGTAKSESSNGSVLVEFNVEVISDDQSASYDSSTNMAVVELPTTVYCQEGDQVIISLYGEDGVKKPTVTGVSGGGDKMNERIEALEEGGGSSDDYFFRKRSSDNTTTSSWVATKANTSQELDHPSLEFNEDNFSLWNGANKELDLDVATNKLSTKSGLVLTATQLLDHYDSTNNTYVLKDSVSNYAWLMVTFSSQGQRIRASGSQTGTRVQSPYYDSIIVPAAWHGSRAVISVVVPDEQSLGDNSLATKRALIHYDSTSLTKTDYPTTATQTTNEIQLVDIVGIRMKPNGNSSDIW